MRASRDTATACTVSVLFALGFLLPTDARAQGRRCRPENTERVPAAAACDAATAFAAVSGTVW